MKLTKYDFIEYLKYIKLLLKEDNEIDNKKAIIDVVQFIEDETHHTPIVEYYDELAEYVVDALKNRISVDIIIWTDIHSWKNYLRRYKIKKII